MTLMRDQRDFQKLFENEHSKVNSSCHSKLYEKELEEMSKSLLINF